MTNKEELKNRFAKITETKWQRGVVIERMLHNDDLDTVFDFFWNEIEEIRKEDMERVVEEIENHPYIRDMHVARYRDEILSIIKQNEN